MNSDFMNSWESIYSEHLESIANLAKAPVHSYIFSGPQAFPSIKALGNEAPPSLLRYAARIFASELFGEYGEGDAKMAMAEQHPNLRIIEPEGRTFRVVDAELVAQEAYIAPQNKQDKKVIICDRFHTADTHTATRLLKVIEEPPAHTILILLAEQQVPLTIVSRCVEKEIPPLPQNKVQEYLLGQNFDAAQSKIIGAAASGDLGRAHFLIFSGYADRRLELWNGVYEYLSRCSESGGGAEAAAGADIVEQVVIIRDFLDEVIESLDAGEKSDESLKREKRRIRDIEIKFGLSMLASRYRENLEQDSESSQNSTQNSVKISSVKIKLLNQAGDSLRHNPNEVVFLTNLLFELSNNSQDYL